MTVIPAKSEDWVFFIMFILAFGLGTLAGYAMKKYARFGVIATGAWLGGVLGSMAYSSLLRLITVETYPLLVLWITILVFAGISGYIANRYFDVAVIFGSSIIGSFLFFRVSITLSFKSFRVLLNSLVVIQMNFLFTKGFREMVQSQFPCTGTWAAWLYSLCFHLFISGMLAIWVPRELSYICLHSEELKLRNTRRSLKAKKMKRKTFEPNAYVKFFH